ncbi:hypothetical protein LWF01_07510 [Saxibacter everestensis]|uniref:Uncharacterized protein n=1 Tax=Saxibacter everestensis TaxID=2909229 RepID=A0ABY8QX42_9MICO|nr:hypothetical protein LWF01_07510 [Brevibacteriaceae bacterium ZFBP1038]
MLTAGHFVRYQSPTPNSRGVHTGIFGLVNGLSRQGLLTASEERWRRVNNDWYDVAYVDPSTIDPGVYDAERNPGAAAWFKPEATHLLNRIEGYLDLLQVHGVPCVKVLSDNPGRVIYQDRDQIVVVPHGPDDRSGGGRDQPGSSRH